MSERQAWFCPSCQKHHGPPVDTCPGVADALPLDGVTVPYKYPRFYPAPERPWWDMPVYLTYPSVTCEAVGRQDTIPMMGVYVS